MLMRPAGNRFASRPLFPRTCQPLCWIYKLIYLESCITGTSGTQSRKSAFGAFSEYWIIIWIVNQIILGDRDLFYRLSRAQGHLLWLLCRLMIAITAILQIESLYRIPAIITSRVEMPNIIPKSASIAILLPIAECFTRYRLQVRRM